MTMPSFRWSGHSVAMRSSYLVASISVNRFRQAADGIAGTSVRRLLISRLLPECGL